MIIIEARVVVVWLDLVLFILEMSFVYCGYIRVTCF